MPDRGSLPEDLVGPRMAELEGAATVSGSDLVLSRWESETQRRGDIASATDQVRLEAGIGIQSLCPGPLEQEPLH